MNARRSPWRLGALALATGMPVASVRSSPISRTPRRRRRCRRPPARPAALPRASRWATSDGQIARRSVARKHRPGDLDIALALAALLTQRADFTGRIADYERALALGEDAVKRHPADPRAWLARAAGRSALHRFADALADLDEARKRGADVNKVDNARAGILQATGKYDQALVLRQRRVGARHDITSLGALAALLGDMGRTAEATQRFAEARKAYRDVSPFPLAWLDFREGLMWQRAGDDGRARPFLEAAVKRLPGYAHATAHLAGLLPPARAIALLEPVVAHSDDPEYAAALASAYAEAGRKDDARRMQDRARAGFTALLARLPAAFADHAARFYLEGRGSPPRRSLGEAQPGVAPDAGGLRSRAAGGARRQRSRREACSVAERASHLPYSAADPRVLVASTLDTCGRTAEAAQVRKLLPSG